jgi:hypothetical protein
VAGDCFAGRRWKADAAGKKLAAVDVAAVAGMLLAAVGAEYLRLADGLAACRLEERMQAIARSAFAVV